MIDIKSVCQYVLFFICVPQLITGHHHTQLFLFVTIDKNIAKEAGAELGQAQVKQDDIVELVVDVVVIALVKVEV